VDGEILEIGVGTGLNLPHYPPHVRKITTADPNPGMNKQLDMQIISSESLPFEQATFNCVVHLNPRLVDPPLPSSLPHRC